MTVVAYSNVGRRPGTNQDNYCILEKTRKDQKIVLAVLCDGLGGLAKGELASKTVTEAFEKWFYEKWEVCIDYWDEKEIKESWEKLLDQCNRKIFQYGSYNNISIGTTVSAMILFEGRYVVMHVGDCRIYELGKGYKLLTEDQVLSYHRQNVLLQCVGGGRKLKPQVICGESGQAYLLCSDGFYHFVSGAQMCEELQNGTMRGERQCTRVLEQMGKGAIARGERDNLSAIYINVGRKVK